MQPCLPEEASCPGSSGKFNVSGRIIGTEKEGVSMGIRELRTGVKTRSLCPNLELILLLA
jgi:hypothetical protein